MHTHRRARSLTFILALALLMTMSVSGRAVASTSGYNAARWQWIHDQKIAMFQRTGSWSVVEDWLKSQGFVVIRSINQPFADSANTDVNYGMAVYLDQNTGDYSIEGTWQWNSMSALDGDLPASCGTSSNVGGNDGAGDWVSDPTGITFTGSWWMDTFDTKSTLRTSTSTATSWDQYGNSFETQDYCWNDSTVQGGRDYSHYRGAVDTIVSVSSSGQTYLKLTYAHTWSSAGLTSVSVGFGGIDFTFSNNSYGWQGTSSPYTWNH